MHPDDDRRSPPHQRPGDGRGAARPDYGQAGHMAGSRGPTPSDRGRKAAQSGKKVAAASGRAATAAVRVARRASHASGAGESGLARLIELHAFNAAGDAALAVSLAGTLFFTVPSGEARGQIALFLAVTMLPFAVVAPLIGPFLDRFRRGRRWAIGATMAVRAFGCWALAGAVASDSVWLFPAALTCLVASKAYGVTRASAVPRLLPEGVTLVKANSRISLAGIAGVTVSGPLAAVTSVIGPEWSLRYAALLFVGATILAVKLPPRVDSSEGEEQVALRDVAAAGGRGKVGIASVVVMALRCNAGLRMLSGFLTIYMAFLLREEPLAGWEDRRTLLLALVIGCVGVGSTLGTVTGNLLKERKPEAIVLVVLIADAVAVLFAGVFFGLIPAMVLGLTAGVSQQLGKLSLDALIQREIPEQVRTSVFARSETLLQMSWVIGGFMGVFMPYIPRLSLLIVAALLMAWLLVILRSQARSRRSARTARAS
ncbi:MAG: MFS transporter [Nocardioidaceae bacterium]